VIVYFHGGGYVVMSSDTHEKLTKQICVGVGAVVVSVDYRLAPRTLPPRRSKTACGIPLGARTRTRARRRSGRIAAAGDSAAGTRRRPCRCA